MKRGVPAPPAGVCQGRPTVIAASIQFSKASQQRLHCNVMLLTRWRSLVKKGCLLWLLGVPIPVIILLYILFGH